MAIFYEVATLDRPANQPFAVMRIDTDKRIGTGCEAIAVSLHWTKDEAKAAAELASAEVRGSA